MDLMESSVNQRLASVSNEVFIPPNQGTVYCDKCDDVQATSQCMCYLMFCSGCLPKHIAAKGRQKPPERHYALGGVGNGTATRVGVWSRVESRSESRASGGITNLNIDSKARRFWNKVTRRVSKEDIQNLFERDEAAKWIGLTIQGYKDGETSHILQTPRLRELLAESMYGFKGAPKTQYPSLVSFVGETGSGKSQISRILKSFS